MKKIVILGSTGSIGENALRVISRFPDRMKVVGIAVNSNYQQALAQAKQFGIRHIAVAEHEAAMRCAEEAGSGIHIYRGVNGLEEVASLSEADTVICSIVGMAGLRPVLSAIKHGKDIALATKEVLVVAGEIVTDAAKRSGSKILPVDSEHSAVFQCMEGREKFVRKIILTASGGPFALKPKIDLNRVTVKAALKHPRWNMGKKVTVDSATLMNKGLEIMEAHWLFDAPLDIIDVVIHPESIIHSLVEFADGAMLAHLSKPDMRFAIQYALTWPERLDGALPALDLAKLGHMRFAKPDCRRFPCLDLARESARTGGTMPVVLNAANEIAVRRFLDGEIKFSGIWKIVEVVMNKHEPRKSPRLDDIMDADKWARFTAEKIRG